MTRLFCLNSKNAKIVVYEGDRDSIFLTHGVDGRVSPIDAQVGFVPREGGKGEDEEDRFRAKP
jgi:hypothetical protein